MKKPLGVAAIALVLALGACARGGDSDHGNAEGNSAAASAEADAGAVRAADEQLLAAFQARDAAAAAAMYTDDATLMIAGRPALSGRDAIQRTVAQDFQDSNFSISFTGAEARASGDLGYTRGSYTVTFTHPETRARASETGSYVTIFRRQDDGSWKVAVDITSPNAPAADGGGGGAPEGNSTAG